MQLQRFQITVATTDESPKVHPYVRGSVSLHGHQYQCLGMYSGAEHMTNVGKVVDLSSSQEKGNCHQVTVSFLLIKPYFSFNDVNQDLHYDGSVETLKKIFGRDDFVQSPGSHIIQWNLWQIPRLFSNSLCIK